MGPLQAICFSDLMYVVRVTYDSILTCGSENTAV